MLLCLFEFLLHFLKYLLKDYMFSSPEPSPDILYNSEAKIPMPKPNISMCKSSSQHIYRTMFTYLN